MPRPYTVVIHALGYIETIIASQKIPWACPVESHAPRGTAPGVTIHRTSRWHSEVWGVGLSNRCEFAVGLFADGGFDRRALAPDEDLFSVLIVIKRATAEIMMLCLAHLTEREHLEPQVEMPKLGLHAPLLQSRQLAAEDIDAWRRAGKSFDRSTRASRNP